MACFLGQKVKATFVDTGRAKPLHKELQTADITCLIDYKKGTFSHKSPDQNLTQGSCVCYIVYILSGLFSFLRCSFSECIKKKPTSYHHLLSAILVQTKQKLLRSSLNKAGVKAPLA